MGLLLRLSTYWSARNRKWLKALGELIHQVTS
jgi:hypothetical protein